MSDEQRRVAQRQTQFEAPARRAPAVRCTALLLSHVGQITPFHARGKIVALLG